MRWTALLMMLCFVVACGGGGEAPRDVADSLEDGSGSGSGAGVEDESPEDEVDFFDPPLALALDGQLVVELEDDLVREDDEDEEEGDDDDGEAVYESFDELAEEIRADYGALALSRVGDADTFILVLAPEQDRDAVLARLERDERIDEVELDVLGRAPEGGPSGTATLGSELIEDIKSQPSLDRMNLASAHAVARGRGVVIAVIDTGVDPNHPALRDNLVSLGADFIDGDFDASEERNGRDDDGDGRVDEQYGHGTFVASLALVSAPDALILPVRALNDDGIGSTSTIAQGIYWAVTQGARVINVSIEMQAETIAVRRAIEFATDSGVLVVAAVGNAGRDEVVFPARNGDVVGVASVRADGVAAGFTNTGSEVDFVAPGVQVIGALPLDLNPTGAGRWSGTSFSTPIVAGVFALMAERFPDQDPSQWRDRLRDTALSVESQNPAVGGDLGNGWAQPAAALR